MGVLCVAMPQRAFIFEILPASANFNVFSCLRESKNSYNIQTKHTNVFFLNPAIFAIWPACVSRGEEAASALHGQLTPQL